MNNRIHYTNCPACNSASIHSVFAVKDNTVSGEFFEVWQCSDCTLRFTQNVPDENAIVKYYQSEDYISHTNTSKGVINSIYQSVRKRTLKQKRKLVSRVTGLDKGNLLDVGSGVGAFVKEMSDHGWNVTGLEPDAGARDVAAKQFGCTLKDSSELFKLPPASFDAITLWHVLEHVHDLHNYLEQLKNLLKENGRLIIAVPNYTSADSSVYKEHWAAYDVPRHLYHFSPQSMKLLLEKHGMKINSCKPMWVDSFYISLLSGKYKNGKTNWISAVWNGMMSNLKAAGDKKKCSSVIYEARR